MEFEEYARIAAAEDDHWWYRNTRRLAAELLAPWLTSATRALDAGCGPGGNGAWLAGHATVVGVDLARPALALVQERHPATLPACSDLQHLPFPDASFDVVTAITVLYAVPDDVGAVTELARVLRPGGALLVVEPAFEVLRRAHDATVHGKRRYRRGGLAGMVRGAGLSVLRSTYAYSFLAPPAAALGVWERRRPPAAGVAPSDLEKRTLDRAFGPLATAERRWLRHHDVPIGTSVVVLAQRA